MDTEEKEAVYATIGRFLKAKHPQFLKDPVFNDGGQYLFCKHHGVVGDSWRITDARCPCADSSAPSKSISRNSIHFAVLMKNNFIAGCTPVRYMNGTDKWAGADILPITTDPAQVSCGACKAKIQASIRRLND
jgi:hypothetical protein